MKKLICLILILLMVLPCIPVSATSTEPAPTETVPEETEPVDDGSEDIPELEGQFDVCEPLTWEKINAIPVANDSMSEDELRKIVVDYMRMQQTVAWKPSRFTTYQNHGKELMLSSDTVYGGMPYVGNSEGNLYKFMLYYDEKTGILDVSAAGQELGYIIGNQCSSSCYWAWARVSNSTTYLGTPDMLEYNGCIPVGDYVIDKSITNFHKDVIRTKNITMDNGPEVMYASYAQMKPGDCIVRYTSKAGHVRMISSNPVVVYNEDGSINGKESYITYLDQDSTWDESVQPDGTPILVQGGVDVKYSFEKMLSNGYLPVTNPELAGLKPVEKATATINRTGACLTAELLANALVQTNYCMSDITVKIIDANGKVIYEHTEPMREINLYEYGVKGAVREKVLAQYVGDGTNTVEISTRVSTGEKLVAYTGKLVSVMPAEPAVPGWVLPVVIVAAVAVVGGVAALIVVKSKKKK